MPVLFSGYAHASASCEKAAHARPDDRGWGPLGGLASSDDFVKDQLVATAKTYHRSNEDNKGT